jgi:Ca2+-binding RTX toxin-like protein
MSSFETIKLAGSLTVGSNFNSIGISNVVASAGLTFNSSALTKAFTVTSSTGNDIITLSDGNDTIKGLDGNDNINTGKGDDKFYLEGNKLDGSDTVTAGLGNDTIIFTSTIGTLADSAFTTVTGVETIQFENANGQIFTYGNNAKNSGVQTVGSITTNIDASALTAANGFTLDSSTLTVDALLNFIGGKGNDLIKTKSDYFLSTDKFDGGDGIDTIEITNAANITDLSFTNVKNIEKIKLNDFANALTLGSRFQSTGITTIGMTAASTLAHAINMSEVTSQKAYNIQGTAGIETISMQNDILKNGNVIIDAKGGVDILVITNASSLTDIAFTNITNLDTIQLSNFNNTIELGNKASTAGVRTVDGSSITTGNVTLDMTNMTADIGAILKGGAKIDTFKVKVDHLTSSDTINGGGDIDILTLSTTGGAITDVDFTNITSIETLSLTKAADYNITLNSGATTLAQTAGIVTVDGTSLLSDDYLILDATNYTVGLKVTSGAGNDTITTGTGNDSIVTGAGNDTISSGTGNDILDGGIGDDKFIFTTTSLTNGDKVQGGSGTDILNITDAVALNGLSTAFQYVSGIETLELDGGGSVVMNAAMITSGIREINGSGSTLALTIDGSAGTTGTKLILTGGAAADKIYAGHGTDTLEGGAAADIFVFSNIANSNGANVVKDFANGVDKIALSFTTGSKDFEDTTRVDAGTLSSSDFGNFVEDVSYATYDTDDNGTLDGNYALITLTGGDTISLLGVSAGIDNADFFYQLIN